MRGIHMTTLANHQPYTLAEDGDSRERRWAHEILPDFGSYETIWSAHLVPLTFRIRDPENHYIRPSVSKHLLDLADAAYATFFHLTECHAWAHRMKKILKALEAKAGWPIRDKTEIVPSEAFYCFFSHAHSMLDSSMDFAEAVNEIIAKYRERGARVFTFKTSSYGFKRLAGWNEPQSEKAYQELTQTVTRYRNALVHRKPVFVLTRRMPQQEYITRWSGLAAICKAAQNRKEFFSQSERVSERLDLLLTQMRTAMEGVWAAAATALNPLLAAKKYHDDQRRMSREDEKLTLEEIKNFLGLTRTG
jgi:hypothetical protein